MSLYQCQNCGCCENTALGHYWIRNEVHEFDWTGIEDRKGLALCSVCAPTKYSDGKPNDGAGEWHGRFDRVFLPMGEFKTNQRGNLQHIATGSEDFRKFAIAASGKEGV